jgi:hypothetical protein
VNVMATTGLGVNPQPGLPSELAPYLGRGSVSHARVRPEVIVVVQPFRQGLASMAEAGEQRLVQAIITHSSVEALDEAVLLRLAWRDVVPLDVAIPRPSQDSRSRATRKPEIEVSATRAKHSRL